MRGIFVPLAILAVKYMHLYLSFLLMSLGRVDPRADHLAYLHSTSS